MKWYFKDCYGCTASISHTRKGFRLKVCNGYGDRFLNKLYTTYKGARIALGKTGEGWEEA